VVVPNPRIIVDAHLGVELEALEDSGSATRHKRPLMSRCTPAGALALSYARPITVRWFATARGDRYIATSYSYAPIIDAARRY